LTDPPKPSLPPSAHPVIDADGRFSPPARRCIEQTMATAVRALATGNSAAAHAASFDKTMPPGMNHGAYGKLKFAANQDAAGAVEDGSVKLTTGHVNVPQVGRIRLSQPVLETPLKAGGLFGVFWIVLGQSNASTRFAGWSSPHDGPIFTAGYDWDADQWTAYDVGGAQSDFEPADDDCIVGRLLRKTGTGIDKLHSLIVHSKGLAPDYEVTLPAPDGAALTVEGVSSIARDRTARPRLRVASAASRTDADLHVRWREAAGRYPGAEISDDFAGDLYQLDPGQTDSETRWVTPRRPLKGTNPDGLFGAFGGGGELLDVGAQWRESDDAGAISDWTTVHDVAIPGDTNAPGPITGAGVVAKGGFNRLRWSNPAGEADRDLKRANWRRNTSSSFGGILLAIPDGAAHYDDHEAPIGTPVWYFATTEDASGNEDLDAFVRVGPITARGSLSDVDTSVPTTDRPPSYYRALGDGEAQPEEKDAPALGWPSTDPSAILRTTVKHATGATPVKQRLEADDTTLRRRSSGPGTWTAWKANFDQDRKPRFNADLLMSDGVTAATDLEYRTSLGQAADVLITDSLLSRAEKRALIHRVNAILNEQASLDAQATAQAITTEKTAYDNAISTLTAYLATLTAPVMWNDKSGQTTVNNTALTSDLSAVDAARAALVAKLSADAATKASYPAVINTPARLDADGAGKLKLDNVNGQLTRNAGSTQAVANVLVYQTNATTVDMADVNQLGQNPKVIGITTAAMTNGQPAQVQVSGPMTVTGVTLTGGLPVYWGGSGLTQTIPAGTAWVRRVGQALSSTVLHVDLGPEIMGPNYGVSPLFGGYPYHPKTLAVLNNTPNFLPTGRRLRLLDDLIQALDDASVFARADAIWVLSGHNSAITRTNLVNPGTFDLAAGSSTFQQDIGWTGNQLTGPALNAVSNWTMNDASLAVFCTTNSADANNAITGDGAGGVTSFSHINPRSVANNFGGAINGVNSNTTYEASITTSIGLFCLQRTASNNVDAWHNGVKTGTLATLTSGGLSASNLVEVTPNLRSVGYARVSKGLTNAQLAAEYAAARAYLLGLSIPGV
jgi:hypothetical protein